MDSVCLLGPPDQEKIQREGKQTEWQKGATRDSSLPRARKLPLQARTVSENRSISAAFPLLFRARFERNVLTSHRNMLPKRKTIHKSPLFYATWRNRSPSTARFPNLRCVVAASNIISWRHSPCEAAHLTAVSPGRTLAPRPISCTVPPGRANGDAAPEDDTSVIVGPVTPRLGPSPAAAGVGVV